MSKIGILAFGSLIDDPEDEIKSATVSYIYDIETPFKVEFARSSSSRNGAPTLVPVIEGGAKVKAVVIVLRDSVSEQEAANMLWRRETRRVGTEETYNPPANPGINTVLVEKITGFAEINLILYTKIAANINPTPELLSDMAIKSAGGNAGATRKDGISYLISAKNYGIVTPLTAGYEKEILRKTEAETLENALAMIRNNINTNT